VVIVVPIYVVDKARSLPVTELNSELVVVQSTPSPASLKGFHVHVWALRAPLAIQSFPQGL
jgi:hypothetical protein